MILSSYIHEQLAAAHRRDLLEAAEQSRLIAQARQRRSERQRFPLPFRGPATAPRDDRRTPRKRIRDSRSRCIDPRPHQLNRGDLGVCAGVPMPARGAWATRHTPNRKDESCKQESRTPRSRCRARARRSSSSEPRSPAPGSPRPCSRWWSCARAKSTAAADVWTSIRARLSTWARAASASTWSRRGGRRRTSATPSAPCWRSQKPPPGSPIVPTR